MRKQLRKSASEGKIQLGNTTHAEKVKNRNVHLQNLNEQLQTLLTRTNSVSIVIRRCLSDFKQRAGFVKANLAVCNKRIELRSERPPKEIFEDEFDEALNGEKGIYLVVQEGLAFKLKEGREFIKPLEKAKKEMRAARLTLQTDRSGYTEKLVSTSSELLQSAEEFCKEGNLLLQDVSTTELARCSTGRTVC